MAKTEEKITPWGPIGYLTFLRTYSRRKADDSADTEEFPETIKRVVDACRTQLKVGFTEEEEKEVTDIMLNLKGIVAGRFLWQLGTRTVKKLGLFSLQNCCFCVVDEPIRPFTWTMDALMLGAGVGYNIQKEHVYQLPKVKSKIKIERRDSADADYIVPDSREGWVKLLSKVLKAHFYSGEGFTYSTQLIRGKGALIRGFGGVASGPEELCWGIQKIHEILNSRSNQKLRPIDCLDIMNIIGAVVVSGNVRRCLPEGSLVHTRGGLVPIEKVVVGTEVLTGDGGYSKVTAFFEQGLQKTINIKTQDGLFSCTPNHKMPVLSDALGNYSWVEAGKLKPGDRLLTARTALEGNNTELPKWEYTYPEKSTTCKSISVPELDSDMAWLIGLFQGDGYTYPNYKDGGYNAYVSLVFGSGEKGIAEKAALQLRRFGDDLNVTIKARKDENSIMVHCQSKQLAWYFDKHVKQAKTAIVVPDYILQGALSVRLAYLAGVLDADGCVSGKPVNVVSTVYGSWAKQLQTLLYSCGLESRLELNYDVYPSREGWQPLHKLNLITLHSIKRFSNIPELTKKLRIPSKSQKANGYPINFFDNGVKRKVGYQALQVNSDFYDKHCAQSNVTSNPVEVISVESGGTYPTYDIEVAGRHEFYAEGYLTHNSAQIAIGDHDDLDFLKAKRWDIGNVPNWRVNSNNSVICDDTSKLSSEFWETYNQGEPYGIINLPLAQSCGRLGETQYPDNCEGFNPCAEQGLANNEVCCLAEIFLPNIESKKELLKVAKYLYRICKHSLSLPCHHKETKEIVAKNMRMGIGVTGFLQASAEQKSWLSDVYKKLRQFDVEYSAEHGWPPSIKLTTIKPSGTLSLLAGVTPGIHPSPAGPYYIRRIRIASGSPLIQTCKEHGYPIEPVKHLDGTDDYNTFVVSFPCQVPEGTPIAGQLSATEHLEIIKQAQKDWSDNSISCTVSYTKEELPEIREWLNANFTDSLKTVSFLLVSGHGFAQAPYETIDKEEYDRVYQETRPITSASFSENDIDATEDCSGGACPIK